MNTVTKKELSELIDNITDFSKKRQTIHKEQQQTGCRPPMYCTGVIRSLENRTIGYVGKSGRGSLNL